MPFKKPLPLKPPDPTAILDWMIWYPAPRGSLSGFRNVRILNFWYGCKNEIAKGVEINKVIKEYIKYLIFNPASHMTANPLNAIKIDVPKSGWVTTRIIGKIRIIVTTNIDWKVLTWLNCIRW